MGQTRPARPEVWEFRARLGRRHPGEGHREVWYRKGSSTGSSEGSTVRRRLDYPFHTPFHSSSYVCVCIRYYDDMDRKCQGKTGSVLASLGPVPNVSSPDGGPQPIADLRRDRATPRQTPAEAGLLGGGRCSRVSRGRSWCGGCAVRVGGLGQPEVSASQGACGACGRGSWSRRSQAALGRSRPGPTAKRPSAI